MWPGGVGFLMSALKTIWLKLTKSKPMANNIQVKLYITGQ